MDANHSDSVISPEIDRNGRRIPAWLKVATVAAASAVAGGLAAAWFYRGTLQRLKNVDSEEQVSNFGREEASRDEDF